VANGDAPDIILTGENLSIPLKSFLYLFGPDIISEKNYKDIFARSTHTLYGADGTINYPVAIDPLVMYVNLDILANAGFQRPPSTWSDIPIYVGRVLDFVASGENVQQRAIALGTIGNVLHGKEILMTLMMQLQNTIIDRNFDIKTTVNQSTKKEESIAIEKYNSMLGFLDEDRAIKNDILAEQSFTFFTSFINPNLKNIYSWSRKYPQDRDLFASGNLGIYFGFASDKKYIDVKNPHLRYVVALTPTPKAADKSFRNVQYGKLYSLSVFKNSQKLELSNSIMLDVVAKDMSGLITKAYGIAPARNDSLYEEQTAPTSDIVYKAADRSDTVLEPIPGLMNTIFTQVLTELAGARTTPAEVIQNADRELARQLKSFSQK
jgi:ABC-type glycerol-3-phosphate transport system substrate-binding protein